jgi:hypothetical protein
MKDLRAPLVAKAIAAVSRVARLSPRVDIRAAALVATLAATFAAAGVAHADGVPTPDRFTATTTGITPSGIGLRIDVREWSDEAARAAAVAALEDEAGAYEAIAGLPTIGYVWQGGTGVGYAVKYAHRDSTPQGERVTFVTDRPLGAFDAKPWTASASEAPPQLAYSVIELYLDEGGGGSGTMSLVAGVKLDATQRLVTLDADAPRVLADAKREPKPYWATK